MKRILALAVLVLSALPAPAQCGSSVSVNVVHQRSFAQVAVVPQYSVAAFAVAPQVVCVPQVVQATALVQTNYQPTFAVPQQMSYAQPQVQVAPLALAASPCVSTPFAVQSLAVQSYGVSNFAVSSHSFFTAPVRAAFAIDRRILVRERERGGFFSRLAVNRGNRGVTRVRIVTR